MKEYLNKFNFFDHEIEYLISNFNSKDEIYKKYLDNYEILSKYYNINYKTNYIDFEMLLYNRKSILLLDDISSKNIDYYYALWNILHS